MEEYLNTSRLTQIIWRNEHEIMVDEICFRTDHNGIPISHIRRNRLSVYEVGTKVRTYLFNKNLAENMQFTLEKNGPHLLCYNKDENLLVLYNKDKEIFKIKLNKICNRLLAENRKWNVITNINPLTARILPLLINQKNAYFSLYFLDSENVYLIRLEFYKNELYIIEKGNFEPISQDPYNPERILFINKCDKNSIYILEPNIYQLKIIKHHLNSYLINWESANLVGKKIFMIIDIKNDSHKLNFLEETKKRLFFYDLETKKLQSFPTPKNFDYYYTSKNYILFTPQFSNIKNQKVDNYLMLFSYNQKLLWKQKIPNFMFALSFPISPLDNRIALWDGKKGKIAIFDISELKSPLQLFLENHSNILYTIISTIDTTLTLENTINIWTNIRQYNTLLLLRFKRPFGNNRQKRTLW